MMQIWGIFAGGCKSRGESGKTVHSGRLLSCSGPKDPVPNPGGRLSRINCSHPKGPGLARLVPGTLTSNILWELGKDTAPVGRV